MLPPVANEENISQVIIWIQKNPEKYPLVGQRALDASIELNVSFAEVNIANRRIKFGLVSLTEPAQPAGKKKNKSVMPAENIELLPN